MRWISTRGASPPVSFREALFAGPAPDGGLYLPERLDPLPPAVLDRLRGASIVECGLEVAAHFDEIDREALRQLLTDALDFPIPLVPLEPAEAGPHDRKAGPHDRKAGPHDRKAGPHDRKAGPHDRRAGSNVGAGFSRLDCACALELFHGPTLAFKDVGARVMARVMAYFRPPGDPFTVLVATSGDTGSAVAQAFAGIEGPRVVVLFPDGQVSDVQEAQFATIGGNVRAVAVAGTFDDCQALVKAAFADEGLRRDARLTSANSINVGRLLPQVFYYAWASMHLGSGGPNHPIFSVPSGNFGNLTAGLIARRLGFPIARFVAATNINDVVPQYLATGRYAPRASVRTSTNAMDVGAPSNFERIRALYGDDVGRLRADVSGAAFDDRAVSAAIGTLDARYGYVADPHSAIGWLGLGGAPGIFLATAHPAKFRETVEPVIGRPVPLPAALREALARPRRVTRIQPRLDDLARLLR